MQEPYDHVFNSQHLLFSVDVRSQSCLDLCDVRFVSIRDDLLDGANYTCAQTIGEWALQRGDVDMIRFQSARCQHGVNLAIANPNSLYSKRPRKSQEWLCQSHTEKISFSSRESDTLHVFERKRFMHEGVFLRPS